MCIFCLFNGNMLFLVGVCAKVVLTFEGCCFFFDCSIAYLDMLCGSFSKKEEDMLCG